MYTLCSMFGRVAVGMRILWEFPQDSHMGWEWKFLQPMGIPTCGNPLGILWEFPHVGKCYGNPVGIPIGLLIDFAQIPIPIPFPQDFCGNSHRIPTYGNDDFPQDSHMWE